MLVSHIRDLEKRLKEVTLEKEMQEQELQMTKSMNLNAQSMNAQHQPVNLFFNSLKLFKIYDIFVVRFTAKFYARFRFKF
jgi:hypothetical protein